MRLYTGKEVAVDDKVCIDDLEMRADVQEKLAKLWFEATT
jgi:enoyl-[acyl-carrier protein] reductase/trans-2-enoyl-CoA reductase (NAD+)